MKIEFTKKQFETLMKLVYLGNWMANAHRVDDIIEKYEKMEDYIFSFAKETGFRKYVDDEDANEGRFYPSRYFEEETDVEKLHYEYDRTNFIEELPIILGDRDFFRKYSVEEIEKMSQEERFLKMQEHIIKWEEEFMENGIERLGIKK